MKPFVQIALGTGQVYELPTDMVAQNRAATMLTLHPSQFTDLQSALNDTHEVFSDDDMIIDWAKHQMTPEEFLQSARLVRFNAPDVDYINANWSAHDQPAMVAEMTGEQVLASPVAAVMTTMQASHQMCNITVLTDKDGAPFGAAILVLGDNNIIGAFITAAQFTCNQLTNKTLNTTIH